MSTSSDNDDDSINSSSPAPANRLPSRVVVTVGTYDGVLAGWELKDRKLEISFASPVHGGSVRSLCLASSPNNPTLPGSLLSTGYDEMLKTHDWHRRLTSSGEVRTPTDFGTPCCSSYAPPASPIAFSATDKPLPSTHCIVGFSSGKVVIYKKRDWSVQHVLAGHVGGVASLAVHPTGKLALSGGHADGKLKLWDLTKGRLSFVTKINSSSATGRSRAASLDPVVSLVWSEDGSMYGYCHGSHITVRDVATGEDCCDVELPSRVNQVALIQGPEGVFVAAACNDGSLPVLAVRTAGNDSESDARRAIMAIEPVEGPVAGEERYKCIRTVAGYYVVTANSAGVVSLMNLQGAIKMIMTGGDSNDSDQEENPAGSDSDSDDDESDDEEMAVDIIDAVQLGSGARVTCLVTWACDTVAQENDDESEEGNENEVEEGTPSKITKADSKKRKLQGGNQEMDPKEVEKARALVAKAKKMQKRKDSKRRKVGPGE